MKNRIWYNIYMIEENKEKVLLAKVRSKGLAMDTLSTFKKVYKVRDDIRITLE